jgi:hypothetical protein
MTIVKILFWPVELIFRLAMFSLRVAGKLIGAFIGLLIGAVGVLLCATVIGAIIGIPLIILGLILVVLAIL